MAPLPTPAHRLVVDGRDVAALERATSVRERSRGLLGREALVGALWLDPCRHVHTWRMRFAIDVALVDRDGLVLHTRTMAPGRFGTVRRATRSVIEAEAGAFERWGLRPGARVAVG